MEFWMAFIFAELFSKDDVAIIFATAFANTEIYERAIIVEPFAFLVKPIDRVSLDSILSTVYRAHSSSINEKSGCWTYSDDVFIKTNNKLIKVSVKDLVAVQSEGNYCTFFTNQKNWLLKRHYTK